MSQITTIPVTSNQSSSLLAHFTMALHALQVQSAFWNQSIMDHLSSLNDFSLECNVSIYNKRRPDDQVISVSPVDNNANPDDTLTILATHSVLVFFIKAILLFFIYYSPHPRR